jgi:hypothetical protein
VNANVDTKLYQALTDASDGGGWHVGWNFHARCVKNTLGRTAARAEGVRRNAQAALSSTPKLVPRADELVSIDPFPTDQVS